MAVTGHGGLLSLRQLMHLACEAAIVPVVCDDLGGIMAFGRTERLAGKAQRLALALRDGGCCYPGCDRPPSWTQAHHIIEWLVGGLTDIDNLCLLCPYHHRHFEKAGWRVEMHEGTPRWIPPTWLDPEQKPRRNSAHHVEIIF